MSDIVVGVDQASEPLLVDAVVGEDSVELAQNDAETLVTEADASSQGSADASNAHLSSDVVDQFKLPSPAQDLVFDVADPSPLSTNAISTGRTSFIFRSSTTDGESKPLLTIEVSESVANHHEESPTNLSPMSTSMSFGGSDVSREGSVVYAIEVLADVSAVPGPPPARAQSAPEVEQHSGSGPVRAASEPCPRLFVSPCDDDSNNNQYFERIVGSEEIYGQVLNVAKDNLFLPLSKNHHSFKVDPKSARGLAIFGLGFELQALQSFHVELPLDNLSGLIDALCMPEFCMAYLKYTQEFRTRMDHIQDQAKKNKAFQSLIDSQFPPNLDGVDEDETLFCIFFRPILHVSQLQYLFFQIFKTADPNAAWFPQLEKLVGVLWHLKNLLVQELRILSQDEVQIHERKEVILKIVANERHKVFGVEADQIPCLSLSLYASPIPIVLLGLTEVLYQNQGFISKGLFRIAPSGDESDRAYERIGDGEDAADVTEDVFVASNLIKIWFRELPVALFQTIDFSKITDETTHEEAGAMIQSLSEPQCSLALWILDLCCVVMLDVEVNAMNSKNLAIVFAPNVTPKVVGDPMSEMKLTRKCEHLLAHAIEWRANHNIKFELPIRSARNRRPLPVPPLVTTSSQSDLHVDTKGGADSTLAVNPTSIRHSLFSVASFKAHIKDASKDMMKRSPTSANELTATKSPMAKSPSRLGIMGRAPPPPPAKLAVALTVCASCGTELPEGDSCKACEGDVEALTPVSHADEDGSDKGKKTRFGIFKGVAKGVRTMTKSPSHERKHSVGVPPPPPAPPLAPERRASNPLTPSDKATGFWSESPSGNGRRISSSKSDSEALTPSPAHRSVGSADFVTGRLRPKEVGAGEAATVWKKTSIRMETVSINVQALMTQILAKPKDQARTDLLTLASELEAGKQKVLAELASLESQT